MPEIRLVVGGDVCPTLTVGDFEKSRYNNECLDKLVLVPIKKEYVEELSGGGSRPNTYKQQCGRKSENA